MTDQRGYYRDGTNSDIGPTKPMELRSYSLRWVQMRRWTETSDCFSSARESTSFTRGSLTVSYTLTGSATNGVDFVQITNSVTLSSNLPYARFSYAVFRALSPEPTKR